MYQLTFKINLKHDGNYFQTPEELASAAGMKSTYLPVSPLGGSPSLVKKHGETFVLYGRQALYLKKLIEQGMAPHVEMDGIPNVTELALSADGNEVTITWTPNSLYLTEVQYRNDDDEWTTLTLVDAGTGVI
jgi:hypothetical protein